MFICLYSKINHFHAAFGSCPRFVNVPYLRFPNPVRECVQLQFITDDSSSDNAILMMNSRQLCCGTFRSNLGPVCPFYNPCSRFTIRVHGLQSTHIVYNPSRWFTIRDYGLKSVFTVYNPPIWFTIHPDGLQSVFTVYNLGSRFTIRAYGLQSVHTVHNPCSQCTIRVHSVQSVFTVHNLCSRCTICAHDPHIRLYYSLHLNSLM